MSPLLLLAQEGPAQAQGETAMLVVVCALAFISVFTFVYLGFLLFSTGWESYEEKYLEGAERSIDDLFLTIPPQQLLWLSILGGFLCFVLAFLGRPRVRLIKIDVDGFIRINSERLCFFFLHIILR